MVVLELIGHIAISFLPMAIPLSALFATIYTMNKLSEDSEIVAMRSFGMKKFELFLPLLICGIFIATSIFVLNRNLIPYSKTQFKNTIIQLTSNGVLSDVKAGQFYTEIPGIILFAEKVDDGGVKFQDVFIRVDKNGEEQAIFAKNGALIKQETADLRAPTLRFFLQDGNIVKSFDDKSDVEKILFKEYDFPVLKGGGLPGFVTKDSMRTNKELSEVIKLREKKLKSKSVSVAEKNIIKSRLPKTKLEYWSRINTPLQVILFVVLGFCLGIKKGRGATKNSGALALLVIAGYYALFFAGVSMARKSQIPAYVAVFFPTLIISIFSIRLFKKLDWMG